MRTGGTVLEFFRHNQSNLRTNLSLNIAGYVHNIQILKIFVFAARNMTIFARRKLYNATNRERSFDRPRFLSLDATK